MTREYHVMMANFPISGVFKKKASSLFDAWKIVDCYVKTAEPYETFYIKEYEVTLVATHYKRGQDPIDGLG